MVAIAILGLGLTVMLSSQAGLLAAIRRVQYETVAASLMRCRMTELELELMEDGFSLLDQVDGGPCCDDEDEPGFSCDWRVEVIELPQPKVFEENPEDTLDASIAEDEEAGLSKPDSPTGVVGALQAIDKSEGAVLGEDAGLGDLANVLGETSGGPSGMISMALNLVYPDLKPMLEASIRKLTVEVKWDEGKRERSFTAVQYITNPLEGSLSPNADAGVDELAEQLLGGGEESEETDE
jgi:general secretion pathway protein I